MNEDKSITNTFRSCNYVGENNADSIMLLISPSYAGIDISKCRVLMCFDNIEIADIPMSLINIKYKNTFCVFDTDIDSELYQHAGRHRFHFQIIGSNTIIKTGNSYIEILNQRGKV